MKFWKMNGAGNDFLIIDNREEHIPYEQLPRLASKLCERHLSIGADGFMVVEESKIADFKMLFFNSDGSVGEMCGNGARCICRYGFENGFSGYIQTIETTAGVVTGEQIDKRNYRIRLNDVTLIESRPVEADGISYDSWYVELGCPGLPHAVVPIRDLQNFPEDKLFALGKKLRYHPAFPKGANINFYELTAAGHIYERTWERGVEGFTYACGTGTGSVGAVLSELGKLPEEKLTADMAGGTLQVEVRRDEKSITDLFLTGPTNIVAKGTVCDEELKL